MCMLDGNFKWEKKQEKEVCINDSSVHRSINNMVKTTIVSIWLRGECKRLYICFLSLSSLNAHHVVFFARKNRVKYIRKYLLVWLLSNYDESFVLMSTGTIKCAISTKTWARVHKH